MRIFFYCMCVVLMVWGGVGRAMELPPSGVVLNYFGFGEGAGNAGIRLDELKEHLEILREENYTVLGLDELVMRLNNRDETLPLRSVAIMWSGSSVTFERGWDIFKDYGFPLTVFVPVDNVGHSGSLSWNFLREMVASGRVDVGSQGGGLINLTRLPLEEVEASLEQSRKKIEEEIGEETFLFSYPFGVTSVAVERMVYKSGFRVGMGQHSGAFNHGYNRFFLPSFGMTKNYSDEVRLRLILSTLALPVERTLYSPLVKAEENPPNVRIWFDKDWERGSVKFRCFHSRQGRLEVLEEGGGFSPVFASPMERGRSRLNCTGSVKDKGTIWWGVQFFVPR